MLMLAVSTGDGVAGSLGAPISGWFAGMPVALPEASSLALLIVGLAAVGVSRRQRAGNAAEASAYVTDADDGTHSHLAGDQ